MNEGYRIFLIIKIYKQALKLFSKANGDAKVTEVENIRDSGDRIRDKAILKSKMFSI